MVMTFDDMSTFNNPVSSPVRLGVIGAGKISQGLVNKLPADLLTVTGIADTDLTAAEALAAKLGAAMVYPNADALFASNEIEAVYIATPPNTHMALTLAAIKAGKHVICEKPWMMNAEEARSVASESKKYPQLKVGCCSSRFCFSPGAEFAKKKIAERALGNLRKVRLIVRSMPPNNSLEKETPWKRDPSSARGGVDADWGVYEIEWLRETLGSAFKPTALTGSVDFWRREDTGMESSFDATVYCGDQLTVQVANICEIGREGCVIELRGDQAGLDVPFTPNAVESSPRIYIVNEEQKLVETQIEGAVTEDWNRILIGPILNLVEAIRSNAPIAAPPESQILVHEILDGIYQSHKTKSAVAISA